MKNSILIVALLTAAVVCSALYSAAADPLANSDLALEERVGDDPEESEMGRGRHFARLAEVLDLTPEQQEQIKAIRSAEREKVEPLRQQLLEGRDKLCLLIEASPFDEAAVRSLAASQADIRTEMIVSRARVQNRINALLTPEQRELAEKLRPFMKEGRGFKGHSR